MLLGTGMSSAMHLALYGLKRHEAVLNRLQSGPQGEGPGRTRVTRLRIPSLASIGTGSRTISAMSISGPGHHT